MTTTPEPRAPSIRYRTVYPTKLAGSTAGEFPRAAGKGARNSVSLRPPLNPCSTDPEPLDVHRKPEQRLRHAHNEQRDVRTTPPEAPAQRRRHSTEYHEAQEEPEDMVRVRDPAPADRLRREQVAEQAKHEKHRTEPGPRPTRSPSHAHTAPSVLVGAAARGARTRRNRGHTRIRISE